MDTDPVVTDRLLDSDPALRWQVERDLLSLPEETWQATQARVAREGFGARLLALQDEDGQWAGGAYFPTRNDPRAQVGTPDQGQPWTATTWSLSALREWGVEASVLGDTADRLAENARWEYNGLPFWGGEVDVCINAHTLANGAWLGADVSGLMDWFAEHQLADGGWNCDWVEGSTRSSFHPTLSTLDALVWCEEHGHLDADRLRALRGPGMEYLASRGLLRRASTGALVGDWVVEAGYPFRWRYTLLRALDVWRRAAALDGVAPDERLADAVAVVRGQQQPDGTWLQQVHHEGQEWFAVDAPVGQPSTWLTLYGLRALQWWGGRS